MLCCPEVSTFYFRKLILTSASEEDYLSIHILCIDHFTIEVAKTLGCNIDELDLRTMSEVIAVDEDMGNAEFDPVIRRQFPVLYIDGPFGSAAAEIFNYEVVILVGAGSGALHFASILKDIYYRLSSPRTETCLRKAYFFWICKDFSSFEWFRCLLMALEVQDIDRHIEMHIVSQYLPTFFQDATLKQ